MNFCSQRFPIPVRTPRNFFITRQILNMRIRFGHYLHGKEIVGSYDCTALNSYKGTLYENAFLEDIGQMPFLFRVSSFAHSAATALPATGGHFAIFFLLPLGHSAETWTSVDGTMCPPFSLPLYFLFQAFFSIGILLFGPVLCILETSIFSIFCIWALGGHWSSFRLIFPACSL